MRFYCILRGRQFRNKAVLSPTSIILLVLVITLSIAVVFVVITSNPPPINYWELVRDVDDCYCDEEMACFQTKNLTLVGKKFDCNLVKYLQRLNLLESSYVEVVNKSTIFDKGFELEKWQPVFVTAASENHFLETRRLVNDVQTKTSNGKIIFYDLGLNKDSAEEVKRWCNVEYFKFQFEEYPEHVENLYNYAWKILIIADQLNKRSNFFYFDSSVEIRDGSNLKVFPQAVRGGRVDPYVLFSYAGHSIYATTFPEFVLYFPMTAQMAKGTQMKQAGINYIVDHALTRQIFKWAVLCALTADCIYPPGSTVKCKFQKDRYTIYLGCHRYDQSAINILVNQLKDRQYYEAGGLISDSATLLHDFNAKLRVRRTEIYKGALLTCP